MTDNPQSSGPWDPFEPHRVVLATISDQCDFDRVLRRRVFIGPNAQLRASTWYVKVLPELTEQWQRQHPDTPQDYFGPTLGTRAVEGDWA